MCEWYTRLIRMKKYSHKRLRKIERVVKGFANHRRLQVLFILDEEPELSVDDLSIRTKSNYKNIADHVAKLAVAGLIMKRSVGHSVRHKLTPLGKSILEFCRILE
jgi:predicted transcriptional regulator